MKRWRFIFLPLLAALALVLTACAGGATPEAAKEAAPAATEAPKPTEAAAPATEAPKPTEVAPAATEASQPTEATSSEPIKIGQSGIHRSNVKNSRSCLQ